MSEHNATTVEDPITSFIQMVKRDIQKIDDPDELLALAQVVVHVFAPEQ